MELLTIAEVQQLFKVSRRTVYNWIAADKLTVVFTPSGMPRIDASKLPRGTHADVPNV
jgi:excisionase family DNA binding protein